MTETAKLADVILPGISYAEKEGTFTNTERRIQRIRKAVTIEGESEAGYLDLYGDHGPYGICTAASDTSRDHG